MPTARILYSLTPLLAAACFLLPAPSTLHAQTLAPPATKREFKEFDVASIKENKSNIPSGQVSMNFPLNGDGYTRTGGLFRVTNFSLSGYLMFAYHLTVPQSVALGNQLPDWARAARYDIDARVDGDPEKDDMRTMMRALLADRFKLKLHPETHEVPVFDLVLVRPGKTGPTLKRHPTGDPDCQAQRVPEAFFSPCRAIGWTPTARQRVAGRNVPLSLFGDNISPVAGRPVIDKTGLTGTYDFTLDFVRDPGPTAGPGTDDTGPTFLEAITEQLGLKLLPSRDPALTYLLDHVEPPSVN